MISIGSRAFAKRTSQAVPVRGSDRPKDVKFTKTLIKIDLSDGRSISAPLNWYPKLKQASEEDRDKYELQSNGIFWPDLDVDVSVLDILDGAPPVGNVPPVAGKHPLEK